MKKICETCGKPFDALFPWSECDDCINKRHIREVQIDIRECGETVFEDKIYCPWCGEIIDGSEMIEAHTDGKFVILCPKCGKDFTLETDVSYSYSTKRELPEIAD